MDQLTVYYREKFKDKYHYYPCGSLTKTRDGFEINVPRFCEKNLFFAFDNKENKQQEVTDGELKV